jgi:Helicase associated domain
MLFQTDDEFESEVTMERQRRQEAQRKRPAAASNNRAVRNNIVKKRAPPRSDLAANTTRPSKKNKKHNHEDISNSHHSHHSTTSTTTTALSRVALPLVSRHHHRYHRVGASSPPAFPLEPTLNDSYHHEDEDDENESNDSDDDDDAEEAAAVIRGSTHEVSKRAIFNAKNEAIWDGWMDQLLQFRAQFGHVHVSRDTHKATHYPLATWCEVQRENYKTRLQILEHGRRKAGNKHARMTDRQLAKLQSVGFRLETLKQPDFDARCHSVRQFYHTHGHTAVPRTYKQDNNLGRWVVSDMLSLSLFGLFSDQLKHNISHCFFFFYFPQGKIKREYAQGKLSEERIAKMQEIAGWQWGKVKKEKKKKKK